MTATVAIETPRLLLRELEPDDLDAIADLYADEDVMRYIGKGGVLPREAAGRYLERQRTLYRERGFGEWATVEKVTGDTVGLCGLILWPDIAGAQELEVAYMLVRRAWGRGLATEAAIAIRDHAVVVLGRDRLVSCIYPAHTASIHVAEKVGMHHEKDFEYEGQTMSLYAWSA
jgi:RimJ/RimL family protein N-acetyltransferase